MKPKTPYNGLYCDDRMGGCPKYYLGHKPANADMRIPDDYLDGVCFLCVKASDDDGREVYDFIGTGFLISIPTRFPAMSIFCLVTAKHIIHAAKLSGHHDIYLRVNTDDDRCITFQLPDDWYYAENSAIDVAAMFIPVVPGLKINSLSTNNFATDEVIQKESIGIGDDVFAIGLFNRRTGDQRNNPIMRTGIIAAMPNEPFEAPDSRNEYNAYLIELRSIGGLSGSPVFVNLDFWRLGPNTFESMVQLGGLTIRRKMYLLGMIRGHWDLQRENNAQDYLAPATDDEEIDRLNTGIAIVTPIQDVLGLINSEPMMKIREMAEADYAKRFEPTLDASKTQTNKST